MSKEIFADVNPYQARVALLEDGNLVEIQIEQRGQERLVGNIYKGRVENVLSGMQAAFVDVGLSKNAFLYVGDILPDASDFEFEGEKENVQKKLEATNIKDVLKRGQEIVVQVLKQQGGTKGVRVTTHISLPGRTIVLMPTVDHIGVSRRITDEKERERLKDLIQQIKPKGMGVIVRTIAEKSSKAEIQGEIEFLVKMWERIKRRASFLSAPRLIHSEETLLFRTIRDMFTPDIDRFIINNKEYYQKILAVVGITQPNMTDKIEYYSEKETENLFDRFQIESKISKTLQRKVWLKSGSYIVIDETEALTAIDVNTGKYTGDYDLQETILKTNLEAAKEIARQLRLRDIGGIIIIDFIDMEEEKNRALVVEELKKALQNDRTKTNVIGMTELGLVEMTRKKVRRTISTILGTQCPCCNGNGKIFSNHTITMHIRNELLKMIHHNDAPAFLVEAYPDVVEFIIKMNGLQEAIMPDIENRNFYITKNQLIHPNTIKIIPLMEKKKPEGCNGAQIFF